MPICKYEYCDNEVVRLTDRSSWRAFCSRICYQRYHRKVTPTVICAVCRKPRPNKFAKGDLCSEACWRIRTNERKRAKKEQIVTECGECGNDFITTNGRQLYCTPDCADNHHRETARQRSRVQGTAGGNTSIESIEGTPLKTYYSDGIATPELQHMTPEKMERYFKSVMSQSEMDRKRGSL